MTTRITTYKTNNPTKYGHARYMTKISLGNYANAVLSDLVDIVFTGNSIIIRNANIDSKKPRKFDKRSFGFSIGNRPEFDGEYNVEEIDCGYELTKINEVY